MNTMTSYVDCLSSEDELEPVHRRLPVISSHSSSSSLHLDQDYYVSDVPSEDLDKLSMCLSEASSEKSERRSTSVFSDILQAQLALWTLIGSLFYTYAWQQHRKKFLVSLFVVLPPVVIVCCTISSLLTAIVLMGRFFSSPVRFEDMLRYRSEDGKEPRLDRRRRSTSANTLNSSVSECSNSHEELPKPVCRKHSQTSSYGSLNQMMLTSPAAAAAAAAAAGPLMRSGSPTSLHSLGNGALGATRCGPAPAHHRLSYTFAHCSGGADEFVG